MHTPHDPIGFELFEILNLVETRKLTPEKLTEIQKLLAQEKKES